MATTKPTTGVKSSPSEQPVVGHLERDGWRKLSQSGGGLFAVLPKNLPQYAQKITITIGG